jgi:hypothetical protein
MDDEERHHLEALLQIHRRNLRRLELRAAEHGLTAVPTGLSNEIEKEQAAIAQIEVQLKPAKEDDQPRGIGLDVVRPSREQESIRVSILSQVLLAIETIERVFHQPLQHTKERYEARTEFNRSSEEIGYPVANMVLHLGRLLAQLRHFRTYQYIQIQNQVSVPDITTDVKAMEELLSNQGLYRSYQDELALYSLTASFSDLEKKIKLYKSQPVEPSFLAEGISWAERFIGDFGNAWTDYFRDVLRNDLPTLAERGIDLSMFPVRDYRRSLHKESDPSQLRIMDESADFVQTLQKLYLDLKAFFVKLDNPN